MPALPRLECRRRAIKKSQIIAEPLEGAANIPDVPQVAIASHSWACEECGLSCSNLWLNLADGYTGSKIFFQKDKNTTQF